jgi:hypothetical protein
MNEYYTLTPEERKELVRKIAEGGISRSCSRAKSDWFNIKLSTGRRCVGAYRWDTDNAECPRPETHTLAEIIDHVSEWPAVAAAFSA